MKLKPRNGTVSRPPRALLATAALLIAVSAGCQQNRPRSPYDYSEHAGPKPSPVKTPDQYPVRDRPSISDLSSERLHEIEGALLLFYSAHGRPPAELSELQESPDPDVPLSLVSPVKNKPYVYIRGGLQSPGKSLRIYVYDPTPLPDGSLRCLLMPEFKRGTPSTSQVLLVPPEVFKTYRTPGE